MDPIKRPRRYHEMTDPQARPRYTGIPTFFRAPHTESLSEADIGVIGVPGRRKQNPALLIHNHGRPGIGAAPVLPGVARPIFMIRLSLGSWPVNRGNLSQRIEVAQRSVVHR